MIRRSGLGRSAAKMLLEKDRWIFGSGDRAADDCLQLSSEMETAAARNALLGDRILPP